MPFTEIQYPSLFLLFIALCLLFYWHGLASVGILMLMVGLVSILINLVYSVSHSFTGDGINEAAFFHINYVLGWKEALMFWPLLLAVVSVLIILIVSACRIYWPQFVKKHRRVHPHLKLSVLIFTPVFFIASVITSPASADFKRYYDKQLSLSIPNKIESEIKYDQGSIDQKTRNLILIYAESLELAFFDQSQFPGLTPRLSRLISDKGLLFEGLKQVSPMGWTIAGMTGSQCGTPIGIGSTPQIANSLLEQEVGTPGSTCLGDILSKEGFYLEYMGGADANFAGKKSFYLGHGFSKFMGKNELDLFAGNELPKSKWGVYDDDLFRLAKDELEEIKRHKKYGLVLLTLDTHSPVGHKTPLCKNMKYRSGEDELLNAVYCADLMISNFIEETLSDRTLNNPIVILASDHLLMNNEIGLEVSNKNRENLFVVFNGPETGVIEKSGTTMDIAPTVLSLVGYGVDSFGLGRNLLSDEETLVEKFTLHGLEEQLVRWQSIFWRKNDG